MKELICCICKKPIKKEGLENYFGNNPRGALIPTSDGLIEPEFKDDDRCCDECDIKFVIPGRIYTLYNKKK